MACEVGLYYVLHITKQRNKNALLRLLPGLGERRRCGLPPHPSPRARLLEGILYKIERGSALCSRPAGRASSVILRARGVQPLSTQTSREAPRGEEAASLGGRGCCQPGRRERERGLSGPLSMVQVDGENGLLGARGRPLCAGCWPLLAQAFLGCRGFSVKACTALAKRGSRSLMFPMRKHVLFPDLSVWRELCLWVITDTQPSSNPTHELIVFLFWGRSLECVSQGEVRVWQGRLLLGALGDALGARVSSAGSSHSHPWLVAPPSTFKLLHPVPPSSSSHPHAVSDSALLHLPPSQQDPVPTLGPAGCAGLAHLGRLSSWVAGRISGPALCLIGLIRGQGYK